MSGYKPGMKPDFLSSIPGVPNPDTRPPAETVMLEPTAFGSTWIFHETVTFFPAARLPISILEEESRSVVFEGR